MSFQNLILLQNLYRLKSLGLKYYDPFFIGESSTNIEPNNIDDLNKNILSCHLCDLNKSRTQSMVGFGNKDADLLFVDFSVSSAQDSKNSYFIGKTGDTLIKMCANVLNIDYKNTYYTHIVKCKPLATNIPSYSECQSCKPYIFKQIEFIKPKIIVTLGKEAYENLTNDFNNFETAKGHVCEFNKYKLVPIYHPSFLLRNPKQKKATLSDLKTIKSYL